MTVTEAAQKWNKTPNQVRELCRTGQIQGAKKVNNVWSIPDGAKDPCPAQTSTQPATEQNPFVAFIKKTLPFIVSLAVAFAGAALFGVSEILGGLLLLGGAMVFSLILHESIPNCKLHPVALCIIVIVGVIFLSSAVFGFMSSGSSSSYSEVSGQPWKELGVSKREYMSVYNGIKYGVWD